MSPLPRYELRERVSRGVGRWWTASFLLLVLSCGATERMPDEETPLPESGDAGGDGQSTPRDPDGLIRGGDEPEPTPSSTVDGGAGTLPNLMVVGGETSMPAPTGSVTSVGTVVMDDAPEPAIDPVVLPDDTSYPWPGLLVDDRASHVANPVSGSGDCSDVVSLLVQGQRTTVGMGVQFRVGLQGAAGFPLNAPDYAGCLSVRRLDGVDVVQSRQGAPATDALTAILVQPSADPADQELLADALKALFRSRPKGERLALLRWGPTVQQVVGLTDRRDSFNDAFERLTPADGDPIDAGTAVTTVQQMLDSVADDAHAWTRNIVVVAPEVAVAEQLAFERDVNVIWAVDTSDVSGFRHVNTTFESMRESMAAVSARLNAIRDAGFVTFGVCGDGEETPVEIAAGYAARGLVLKDALAEERAGDCNTQVVRDFEYYDTRLVQLTFSEEQRAIYDDAVADRDDEVVFEASARLSPEHGETPTMANLRGGTSLARCPANRMNLSVDFEGGRERFFYPESSGSVGSDEFYLTAMCLDPMYVNQLTMDRLMASLGMFVSGVKLVEVRVDGSTQGVYLLMEQVKEALVRTQSDLMAVVRRRTSTPEVKFPGENDPTGQDVALELFQALRNDVEDLPGDERLAALSGRLDLHRYMFFVALQSVVFNADWGDEPTFYGTATLGPGGSTPLFSINGWDPDDVLLDDCAHSGVLEDSFGMIGCAEDVLEKAIFGADRRADEVLDDEVYAMYVDALEVVLDYVTEDLIEEYYAQTVDELRDFMADPDIVSVMPEWDDANDPEAALDDLVQDRLRTFAERHSYLRSQLESYRSSH